MIKIDKNNKCLIIPDVHQNIGFVKTCLERLNDDFDYVIFLGDYYDTFRDIDNIDHFSVAKTSEYLQELHEIYNDKVIWLAGNHDIAYLATYSYKMFPPKNTYYYCSGYTRQKAKDFNFNTRSRWIDSWQLSCKVGKFHLTHGGWHINHFIPHNSTEENIELLCNKWEIEKSFFSKDPFHWIWNVSSLRGGPHKTSSPVWLDWYELQPISGINQIVGHSNSLDFVYRDKTTEDSENHCLDCNQQMFAILQNDKLTIQKVVDSF